MIYGEIRLKHGKRCEKTEKTRNNSCYVTNNGKKWGVND